MNNKNLQILPYLLAGIFVVIYVTIRVFTIPITVDEAWTLYSFVRAPLWDVITIKEPSTNNHIFNTLLVKLTTIFSEKQFFLRLPNLLSLLLYVYGSYILSKQLISNKLLAFALYATLLTNFTLLDFFGLCRGYGLSIGLLTFAMGLLVRNIQHEIKNRDIHLILFSATAAFYANIAVLHVMAVVVLATGILLFTRNKHQSFFKRLQLPIIYTIAIIILGGLKLWKQYQLGEIFYGGSNNFIDDTIYTMMQDYTGLVFFNEHHSWVMNIAVSLMIFSTLVPILFIGKLSHQPAVFAPIFILLFCILMTNIQFYAMGVYLPINRIGLFFYPLVVISIFAAIQLLYAYAKPVCLIIGIGVMSFSIWRFASEMNTSKMSLWWIDMYSRAVVDDIAEDYKGLGKPKIYAFSPSDNAINYYVNVYHTGEIIETPCCTPYESLDSVEQYDYLYLSIHHDVSKYPQFVKIKAYHVDSSLVLYKNQQSR